MAPWYDRAFRFLGAAELQRLLDLRDGLSILDIGGGTGRVSDALTCRCVRVVLDASPGMLRQARAKELPTCYAVAERLPFADASIDRALMVDSLHHLNDQGLAVAEALRVLRPGGRLVIEEPNIRHRAIGVIAFVERLLPVRSRFLNSDDMAGLLRDAGGTVSAITGEGSTVVRLVALKP